MNGGIEGPAAEREWDKKRGFAYARPLLGIESVQRSINRTGPRQLGRPGLVVRTNVG